MTNLHVEYLVNSRGKRTKVVLPIHEFEELLEQAEDVLDSAEIERLRSEPRYAWADVQTVYRES